MVISVLFSVAIYTRVNVEFTRFEQVQIRLQDDIQNGALPQNLTSANNPHFGRIDSSEIAQSRTSLILVLIFLNLGILIISGGAGYFLAGITLRPIKEMVDEQNRFVTDSSHELRTPLTSLRSEIEIGLRNKNMTIEDARKLLGSNLEDVLSLQVLSDNLLELAQNGSSIKTVDMKEASLLFLVNEAVKKVNTLAKEKEIKIENKVKDVKIKVVKDRLTEVFIILLDNAIKYSKNKEKVIIESKVIGGRVEVSIINNGIGIEPSDRPYIFDRFYRADKSRSGTSGYGLGLSIAKKIVESHHGKIEAESVPGKETTFVVSLPI
jgi:signal transduction histidine kinase